MRIFEVTGCKSDRRNLAFEVCIISDVFAHALFQNVGCDWVLDSEAVEDVCGVCDGDASTCDFVDEVNSESGEGNLIIFRERLKLETLIIRIFMIFLRGV